jgi:hypothetical protein
MTTKHLLVRVNQNLSRVIIAREAALALNGQGGQGKNIYLSPARAHAHACTRAYTHTRIDRHFYPDHPGQWLWDLIGGLLLPWTDPDRTLTMTLGLKNGD